MRSFSFLSSCLFTCALLLMVGCDSTSPSTSTVKQDPSIDASTEKASDENPSNANASDANPDRGQSAVTTPSLLAVGSAAPSLAIEHWLSDGHGKFQEVTEFESGKVYVVEFWATWCGPCIRSMPHLVELQESFADKDVQIISVSQEDLPTVKNMLSKPFESSQDDGPSTYGELTSAYCLTADPDGSVNEDYMKASKQKGIPCAFIVGKSGLIEWIGHPMKMDKPLQQVVDGTWNPEQAAKMIALEQKFTRVQSDVFGLARNGKFDEAKELLSSEKESLGEDFTEPLEHLGIRLTLSSVQKLVEEGNIDDAIDEIQEAGKTANGPAKTMLDGKLITLFIQGKQYEKAIVALNSELEDWSAQEYNEVAWKIYQHATEPNDIPVELQNAAIKTAEKAVGKDPKEGAALDTLAHLLHLAGDLDRALEVQTKAMENPGPSQEEIEDFLNQLRKEKEAETAS